MARLSYAVLQAKIHKEIEKLRKQAAVLQSKKRKPVIESIIRSMKEYEISPEEIVAAFGKPGTAKSKTPRKTAATTRGPRGPVAPKYRNPETGSTWTGRGKAPRWIVEAEAAGKPRQGFLIA